MIIIPAIDVLDTKVVRLTEGDFNQKTDYNIGIEAMIETYQSHDIDFIHIIDLNGSKGETINQAILADIIQKTKIKIQYGGGIRNIDQVLQLLSWGVSRVIVGTQAIVEPDFTQKLAEALQAKNLPLSSIVLAIDVLDEIIKYNGWQDAAKISLYDFIEQNRALGFEHFLCTDISKDGKLQGPATDLYQKLMQKYPGIQLIASGGVAKFDDIIELQAIQPESVVVGKAIYENHIKIEDIEAWNREQKALNN
jgi:phosphoribosylformimino-5-aminoimidazole carboxamide ribotide isomerase